MRFAHKTDDSDHFDTHRTPKPLMKIANDLAPAAPQTVQKCNIIRFEAALGCINRHS
jgi:hypothetical protein